jgi:rhodanese-related sulfurtransferase
MKLLLSFFLLIVTLNATKIDIAAPQLSTMLQKGALVLFDIRTSPEWSETGIIKESIPLTFFDEKGRYDMKLFMQTFNRHVKDKKTPIAFICRSGSRTLPVSRYFSDTGHQNVYNITGGILGWKKAKFSLIPYK